MFPKPTSRASFKQAFGVPPHRYLLTRRIERATALLRDTELPSPRSPSTPAGRAWARRPQPSATSPARARARSAPVPRAAANELGPRARLHRQRRAPARPQDRSFGEAAARRRRYKRTRSKGGSMKLGIEVVGLYVHDQDEALAFYVDKLGFNVHTDVRNGDYRWLTVQHPDQPSFQLGLFAPGPAGARCGDGADAARGGRQGRDAAARAGGRRLPRRLRAHARPRREFTQEPVDRYGTVDAGFRDPSGNGWKLIQARR
jgi:catechol 2,3-dioxygenase-like lactoylglutathione lyase family enzyme/AraC-like DNA-binding protein